MPNLVSDPGLAQPGALRPGFPGSPGFPGTPGYPIPFQLPGNLLPPADCGFSSFTGNWAPFSNCTIALSGAHAMYPTTQSLAVTATAAGTVSFFAGQLAKFPVTPSSGLVSSFWIWTANPGRTAYSNIWYYTPGNAFISFPPTSAPVPCTAGAWTPVAGQGTAPATAGLGQDFITVTGLAAGETVWIDLVYVARSLWQILAAWPTSPLSSTPVYADMTPFVRADQPITYTRGRADETSTVQAGSCSFTLDNMVVPGGFSPGNLSSPFTGVTVGKRIQLNAADETGTWHTRFTGFVTSINPGWQGGPGLESTVVVQGQDLLAWLARFNTLRTMVEEEILTDSPGVLYTLADPSSSTTAADSSGNSAVPLRKRTYGTGGTMSFGNTGKVIGSAAAGFTSSPLAAAFFTPNLVNGYGVQLEGNLPSVVSAAAGCSMEVWYQLAPGTGAGTVVPMSLGLKRRGHAILPLINATAGQCFLAYLPNASAGALTLSAGFTLPATTGQIVVTVSGTTATMYINGTSVATVTVPASFTADSVTVGGPYGGPWSNGGYLSSGAVVWDGQLNCFAVYSTVLSGARITRHYTAGSNQNQGQLISQLISNILDYESIPASLRSITAGASYADAFEITGQTPLSMIQQYQATDGGVFYVNSAGQLAWQDRTARYAAQVTPALTLAAGQYQEDLTFPVSTQFIADDATFANNNLPGGVRAISTAALAANGPYPVGSPQSPQTAPYWSYPYSFPNAAGGLVANPDVITDAANWQVNIYGSPVPRSPNVTVELGSQPGGGTNVSRAACYGCDVGSVIQLNGLPASAPGGSRVSFLMTEGVTETFQRDRNGVAWTLAFNTSPASYSAAWIAGDSNMGVLDSTAVPGRGTDGSPSGSPPPATYVGPPYPVPTFSGGMNVTGNVGANDMRGLTYNTSLQVYPPAATAQQVSLAQSIANSTATQVQFDNLWYDTQSGFAFGTSAAQYQTYTVQLPGLYLLTATVVFATNAIGQRQAWLERNGTIIDAVSAEAVAFSTNPAGVSVTAEVQCAIGDTLQLWCSQNSGGALGLVASAGGCVFSALWIGT